MLGEILHLFINWDTVKKIQLRNEAEVQTPRKICIKLGKWTATFRDNKKTSKLPKIHVSFLIIRLEFLNVIG